MNIDAAHSSANVSGWPLAIVRGTADDASQAKEAASHKSPSRADPSSQGADGVSHAEQYQKTSDRDVDGRLPWQANDKSSSRCPDEQSDREETTTETSGPVDEQVGQLDVSG